jgi:hypothetical protein
MDSIPGRALDAGCATGRGTQCRTRSDGTGKAVREQG